MGKDVDSLEVERLKAEIDKLRAESESLKAHVLLGYCKVAIGGLSLIATIVFIIIRTATLLIQVNNGDGQ